MKNTHTNETKYKISEYRKGKPTTLGRKMIMVDGRRKYIKVSA